MRNTIWAVMGITLFVVGTAQADDALKADEEGFIRNWLVLATLPFGQADNGSEALGKQQVTDEATLQPTAPTKFKSRDQEATGTAYNSDSYLVDFDVFLEYQEQ